MIMLKLPALSDQSSVTGSVAQRIRHLTTNQGIAGSSPARVKNFLPTLLFRVDATQGKKNKRPRVGSNHQPFG